MDFFMWLLKVYDGQEPVGIMTIIFTLPVRERERAAWPSLHMLTYAHTSARGVGSRVARDCRAMCEADSMLELPG